MPKELVCTGVRKLEWREYDLPALQADEVLIRARFGASKHGTEMASYKGYASQRGSYDRELRLFLKNEETGAQRSHPVGNMIVGVVEVRGAAVKDLEEGDDVLTGSGFRERVVAKAAGCLKVPAGVPWQSAVCLDPALFAYAAIRDGHVRVGDAVAVFGMGAIGLMAIQVARMAGASQVIAVDLLPIRIEAARACGADLVLDPSKCDAGLEIKKATAKRGADVAIEYSGSHQALQAAIRGVAYGGNVVAGAFPGPFGPGLDLGAEAHLNIPNLIFTRACSQPDRDHPRWTEKRIHENCWRLLCEGTLKGEAIVKPVVPFSSLLEEYPKIDTEPESNIKLGVAF